MRDVWLKKTLAEVCEIVNGGTPDTTKIDYWGGNHFWITPAEMGKRRSPYVEDTNRKLTDEGLRNCSANPLPPYSVILSSRAPIGHLVINTKPMSTNQGCKGLVPSDKLDYKFLYYFLYANVDLLNALGTGTTFKELSGSKLKEVLLPFPSLPVQQQIVAILDQAFAAIETAKTNTVKNLQNVRELYDGELRKIFCKPNDNWVKISLEEVCINLHQGLNTAGEKVKFYKTGFPIIQTRNITDGEIDLDNKIKKMSNEDWLKYKDKYRPEIGDVFFTNIGTIGKTAIVTQSLDYCPGMD
ncbi:MAG: restriction endonuclease subunit S [Chloroflexi bacterium]|nr:restriction endonuclease subunit S [Chloroflexota bacterium]